MGGKGSGRRILSYEEIIEEIDELLVEIQGQLEAAHSARALSLPLIKAFFV
jgi:hypothetical protein